jgi:hypothetical protein
VPVAAANSRISKSDPADFHGWAFRNIGSPQVLSAQGRELSSAFRIASNWRTRTSSAWLNGSLQSGAAAEQFSGPRDAKAAVQPIVGNLSCQQNTAQIRRRCLRPAGCGSGDPASNQTIQGATQRARQADGAAAGLIVTRCSWMQTPFCSSKQTNSGHFQHRFRER